MCVAMRSRNQRSWLITMMEPANSSSASSSARSVSTSRSFDGSSSISTLAPMASVLARRTGARSPPARVAGRGAARHRELAGDEVVEAARDVLPDGLVVLELLPALLDERHLGGGTDLDGAAVGLLLAGDHAEQRRLAGAVGADDADDRAGGDHEAQVVDQQAVSEPLGHVLEL